MKVKSMYRKARSRMNQILDLALAMKVLYKGKFRKGW